MVKLVQEEGLDLDVVSEGELYTALEAGYDSSHIHFHGIIKQSMKFNMP